MFQNPIQDPTLHSVFSYSLLRSVQPCSFPLYFMTLTFLKSTGQFCCQMSLSLDLFDVFSQLG